MNIIAVALLALGYTLFYWGANNIFQWDKSVSTTQAATMSVLFGLAGSASDRPLHPIPFPYTAATNLNGTDTASTSGDVTGTANTPQTGGFGNPALSPGFTSPQANVPGVPTPATAGTGSAPTSPSITYPWESGMGTSSNVKAPVWGKVFGI